MTETWHEYPARHLDAESEINALAFTCPCGQEVALDTAFPIPWTCFTCGKRYRVRMVLELLERA